MSKIIITTVGTSIISNRLYPEEFKTEIGGLINEQISLESLWDKDTIIQAVSANIKEALDNNRGSKSLSAEIESLRAFKNSEGLGLSLDDQIVLLFTDTEAGKFCAEVTKRVLEELKWCEILEPKLIAGMKIKKILQSDEDISESFIKAGLKNLKKVVEEVLQNKEYDKKYFNITAGFKATIPFATILAFEKGLSLIYLYEGSNDLILIPPPHDFRCEFEKTRTGTKAYRPRRTGAAY